MGLAVFLWNLLPTTACSDQVQYKYKLLATNKTFLRRSIAWKGRTVSNRLG